MTKKQFLFIALTVLLFGACQKNEVETYTQYVDPFVGTTFTGHTFPNATYSYQRRWNIGI